MFNDPTIEAINRKDVILSAGSLCGPQGQILMVLGIGPENHLKKLKLKI